MITLKRLTANNFKGLRSVDLVFPQRGSVLIEGYNEAGKSTLFEAVYVALYGKPLVGEDKTARQEEVIQHGQSRSTVQLTFNVGPEELTIERVFERGKNQQARLTIQRPGIQPEVINRVRAVDERLLKELGNLDGESLRNSCFVEQKELGRIETLSLEQRKQAIQKLLGLERLMKLVDQFKYRREQEHELRLAESFLKLAQLQAEVAKALTQEAELAERLDAVKVASQLEHMVSLEAQRARSEERLKACMLRIQETSTRLERCSALRGQVTSWDKASQQMGTVRHACDALVRIEGELAQLAIIEKVRLPEARAYLNEVSAVVEAVRVTKQAREDVRAAEETLGKAQQQLQILERDTGEQQRLTDELTQAQSRVVERQKDAAAKRREYIQRLDELEDREDNLKQILTQVQEWEATKSELQIIQQSIIAAQGREQELIRLKEVLRQRENEVRTKEIAVAQAEREMQAATDAAHLATAYEALTAWIRLKHVERNIAGYTEHEGGLATRRRDAEVALANARKKTRMPLLAGVVFAVLVCLCIVVGFLWIPAFILAVLCTVGAVIAWIWFFQTGKAVREKAKSLAQCNTDLQRLEMQRQAAIQTGGDPTTIHQYEQQLQNAGISVPSSPDAAYALQEDLRQKASVTQGYFALQAIAQEARANHIRLSEQLLQARLAFDTGKSVVNRTLQAGDPIAQLRGLRIRLAEQERIVATAEQRARSSLMVVADIEWPITSNVLQTLLVKCQAEIDATKKAQKQQELVAAGFIKDAEASKAKTESLLRAVQQKIAIQQASNPAGVVSKASERLTVAQTICRQREEALPPFLQRIKLRHEAEVEREQGSATAQVRALEKQLDTYPSKRGESQRLQNTFTNALSSAMKMINDLLTTSTALALTYVPALPQVSSDYHAFPSNEDALKETLNKMKHVLDAELVALDERGTSNALNQAHQEKGSIEAERDRVENEMRKRRQAIDEILLSRKVASSSEYTLASMSQRWPLLADVLPEEESKVAGELDGARKHLYAAQQQEEQLTKELHHPGTPLSIEEWQQKVAELIEERAICFSATKLLKETHERIARRVLPITERNMQPLLQQLTGGRYRDVLLTPLDDNGQLGEMDYRIRVWDPAAGRYVAKNLFSGGTRDQCSLALRLAFALATLPQELGVAPGFIFLDEPLSAFDAQRAQALVELLTTGTIAQQFHQVVLISHYHAFDREAFQYHVRLEAGQIIETDLPITVESDLMQLEATV